MADQREKVLSVNNLVINFKTDNGILKAVRNVSFDLYQGETLCIVGESGSGKSVTSKTIMGILANNAIIADGNIISRGENLLEVSEDEFYKIRGHKIGMIFQDPLSSLNPIVKIGKQITETIRLSEPGISRRDARKRSAAPRRWWPRWTNSASATARTRAPARWSARRASTSRTSRA